ncbi:MAG: ABC transporter substrate-binding protein [Brevinema sp.]
MKKLSILLCIFTLLGCTKSTSSDVQANNYNWDKVIADSQNTTVSIYMWGGSDQINGYMDNVVAPRLKELNNITLQRIPINDVKDLVNKLIVEKQAGKTVGSADILWINGENFKTFKEAGLTWGSFAEGLPSSAYVSASAMNTDFGVPIEGLEMPWGEAQFNFISRDGSSKFTNAASLMAYVRQNPGRFTYPALPDFTGDAFVRNIAIDILGEENILSMSASQLQEALAPVWQYFNDMKPYLWKQGETYPESVGKLSLLFANNNVDVTMNYGIGYVAEQIESKQFPATSKSFLLTKGTLYNHHYLSIPINAPNKNGALYVINYLTSFEAQASKQDSSLYWSDYTVLDLAKLDEEQVATLKQLTEAPGVLPLEDLQRHRVAELSTDKSEIIRAGWLSNVGITY